MECVDCGNTQSAGGAWIPTQYESIYLCKDCLVKRASFQEPWIKLNRGRCKHCDKPLKNENTIVVTNLITFQKDGMYCIWGDLLACSPECLLAMVGLAVKKTDV